MPMIMSAKGKRFMNMGTLANAFAANITGIETDAAREATATSRARFDNQRGFPYGRRPFAPSRRGRLSTEGLFSSRIEWTANGKGAITIDVAQLPWYWIIQEIGTGKEAKSLNPPISYTVTSQIGRQISASLMWSTGIGGAASGPSSQTRGQQLFFALDLDQKSVAGIRPQRGHIHHEIEGKHFIFAGGQWGVFELGRALVDEAQRTFR